MKADRTPAIIHFPTVPAVDDVLSLVKDDPKVRGLDGEQQRALAQRFLGQIGRHLEEVLRQHGNEITAQMWEEWKDALLRTPSGPDDGADTPMSRGELSPFS